MVGEIGVHDDHEVSGDELETMNVCGSKTELSSARTELDLVTSVDFDQLFCDILGAIGGGVVDDNELPCEVTFWRVSYYGALQLGGIEYLTILQSLLFGKGLCKQPGDDGKVLALLVGRENDGVLVGLGSRSHFIVFERAVEFGGVTSVVPLFGFVSRNGCSW